MGVAVVLAALAGPGADQAVAGGKKAKQAPAFAATMPLPVVSPIAAEKRAAILRSFGAPALDYLEGLKGKEKYLAPSEIDPRYTMAFYVNASGSGKNAQRMWFLQREEIGGEWRLGLWDKKLWSRKGLPSGMMPPYSWLVSTGRKYRGDSRSGPTPTGVFAIDERKYRLARGYASPGMINVVYIDLHYSGGRRSGVAFHGTTYGRYRRLGRIDSHGCIRMTQKNALAVLNRLQGRDKNLSDDMRWGEVPRFWKTQRGGRRYGYNRRGISIPVEPEQTARAPTGSMSDATPLPHVLTKTGYRAIAIIFQD